MRELIQLCDGHQGHMCSCVPFNSVKLTQVHCPTNIGAITSVRLRIEGTDGWNVHSVTVHDYVNDHVTHFACNCWLDSGAGAVGPSTRFLNNTFMGNSTLKLLCKVDDLRYI